MALQHHRNLKLGWKLGIGFGAVIALCIALSAAVWLRLTAVRAEVDEMVHHEVKGMREAAHIQARAMKIRIGVYQVLGASSVAERAKILDELKPIQADLDKDLADLRAAALSGSEGDVQHEAMAQSTAEAAAGWEE